ncbi:hypothetical protein [Gimesia maris]|uniref:hypothetical protein n=1 Tax=Gimesia maris TaxID=122 RepID=UPI0032EED18F
MKRINLPDEMVERGTALLTEFRDVLNNLIGEPLHEYQLNGVLLSNEGPTFDLHGDNATVYVGPNAMQYEPTFFANLAHESAHLHVTDGTRGNASGLEEGFATYFELFMIQAQYGNDERTHFERHLPKNYLICLQDYQLLLNAYPKAIESVLKVFGRLTGPSCFQFHSLFPTMSWRTCYRLAHRKRMRS